MWSLAYWISQKKSFFVKKKRKETKGAHAASLYSVGASAFTVWKNCQVSILTCGNYKSDTAAKWWR